ncbi:hypothetical protein TNCV_1813541 [Trichonephila clavipes]|uniref:Uncharacterized protein n=1 Tax=Trichonephila clavipes TaxID=2585209 RepID=A0A8X7BGR9_TRICX|nr:hypothetical protein TNCV_1813541 [Trichonephila clavipes]
MTQGGLQEDGDLRRRQLILHLSHSEWSVALSIMQGTIQFGLVPPQFSGRTSGGGQRPSNCLTLPPTSRENLLLVRYSEYPHATKALYIYKHPCFLRDLNPGRTTQQSVSLTTVSGGQQNICA